LGSLTVAKVADPRNCGPHNEGAGSSSLSAMSPCWASANHCGKVSVIDGGALAGEVNAGLAACRLCAVLRKPA